MRQICRICEMHLEGISPGDIVERLQSEENRKTPYSREIVYRAIRDAARLGYLKFLPPLEYELARKIELRAKWLHSARVVLAVSRDSVANHCAEVVYELIVSKPEQRVFHIGFGGGRTTSLIAAELARLLSRPLPDRKSKLELVFHSLVPGLDDNKLLTDPTAFFMHFAAPEVQKWVSVEFLTLHAPGIIRTRERDAVFTHPLIDRVRIKRDDQLDIIVSSVGSMRDQHSMITPYTNVWEKEEVDTFKQELTAAGCVGDIMWLPIGPDGPIETELSLMATAMISLKDIQDRIEHGRTRVVLALGTSSLSAGKGPAKGGEPQSEKPAKADVLLALLKLGNRKPGPVQLCTDIVVEYDTAVKVIEEMATP